MPRAVPDARGAARDARGDHPRATVDDRIGELLEELEPYAASLPHDSDDACLIRVARRDWEKARRVPAELAAEIADAAAEAYEVWVKAREEYDFAVFRPWLERMVELRRRYVECFAPLRRRRTTSSSTTTSRG